MRQRTNKQAGFTRCGLIWQEVCHQPDTDQVCWPICSFLVSREIYFAEKLLDFVEP